MDDSTLNRYTITQVSEHTYKLDDTLSNQTSEIDILRNDHTEFIENLKKSALPIQNSG